MFSWTPHHCRISWWWFPHTLPHYFNGYSIPPSTPVAWLWFPHEPPSVLHGDLIVSCPISLQVNFSHSVSSVVNCAMSTCLQHVCVGYMSGGFFFFFLKDDWIIQRLVVMAFNAMMESWVHSNTDSELIFWRDLLKGFISNISPFFLSVSTKLVHSGLPLFSSPPFPPLCSTVQPNSI